MNTVENFPQMWVMRYNILAKKSSDQHWERYERRKRSLDLRRVKSKSSAWNVSLTGINDVSNVNLNGEGFI